MEVFRPFLCMAVIQASSHSEGTIPSLRDLVKSINRGSQRISAKLCRKYGCQPSKPVDFPGFKEFNFSNTISRVITIDVNGMPA